MNDISVCKGEFDCIENSFREFFASLHKEAEPYQWQIECLRYVIENHRFPDWLWLSTATGKTVVIDIHLFVNGLGGLDERYSKIAESMPRRLAMTINRRAMVDDQYGYALDLREKMKSSSNHVVKRILRGLKHREIKDGSDEAFGVVLLRGGLGLDRPASREWRFAPSRVCILCVTPDMLGSRLLFRGYGITKYARPVEAGLLAFDTAVVLDEAHMNHQLAKTLHRVSCMAADGYESIGVSPLNICVASATLPESMRKSGDGIELKKKGESSLYVSLCRDGKELSSMVEGNKSLKRRMMAEKTIHFKEDLAFDEIAKEAERMHGDRPGRKPVAVYFNDPYKAMGFRNKLKEVARDKGENWDIETMVGRQRTYDKSKLMKRLRRHGIVEEGVKDFSECDFVIGTQAMEVGIDADFSAMLSELSDGPSLVQRAGRLNREGSFGKSELLVFTCKESESKSIYEKADTDKVKEGVKRKEGESFCPLSDLAKEFAGDEVARRRAAFERVEYADAEYFSHSSEALSAETGKNSSDLLLWLQDDLEKQDVEVFFCVRRYIGGEYVDDKIVDAVRPLDAELIPCPLKIAREYIKKNVFKLNFYFRGGKLKKWNELSSCAAGDIYLVDESTEIFYADIVPYLTDESEKDLSAKDDVYENVVEGLGSNEKKSMSVLLDRDSLPDFFDSLPSLNTDEERSEKCFSLLRAKRESWCNEDESENEESVSIREKRCDCALEVMEMNRSDEGVPDGSWVLAGDGNAAVFVPSYQDLTKEERLKAAKDIELADHLESVEKYVRKLADAAGLTKSLGESLASAALYHDVGKMASGFQSKCLKNGEQNRFLAKSARAGAMGNGWRHEQLSAAMAWVMLEGESKESRELITRLVGTSHGRGRSLFSSGPKEVLSGDMISSESPERGDALISAAYGTGLFGAAEKASACLREAVEELFGVGLWERLVSQTDSRFGIWGMAYLEALLRAADCCISAKEVER